MERKIEARDGKVEDEEMYVKLVEEDPRNVEAVKMVFLEKIRRGKGKEGLEFVKRLVDLQQFEWRLLEALCYSMMGELGEAEKLLECFLAEWPLLVRASNDLAMLIPENCDVPGVFEMLLNEALEIACHEKRVTEGRNIRILIAQMHVVKGEFKEGLRKLQVLVDENPREFRPYLCQVIVYSLLNKTEEAAEQFGIYRSLVQKKFPQKRIP